MVLWQVVGCEACALTLAAHALRLLLPAEAQQYDCHGAAQQASTCTPAEVFQAGHF